MEHILIALVLQLPAAFLIYRRSLHMFQLCSYQNQSYKKYLRENRAETFAVRRLLPVAFTAVSGTLAIWPMALAGMILFVVVNHVQKGKKPLVWTARAKRLTATWGILYILIALVTLAPPSLGLSIVISAAAALYALFMPYLIMALAAINSPVEKSVANHYLNDAKKILASNPSLKIIGITGSYGKTSTKYFLKELLSVKYNVYMTPGNYNTPMGVTRAVREGLRPTHEIFLCEMGARHVGDITELCRLVHPHMGIVTSIGPQHLETFGSQDNITNEKLELYRATRERDGAFLNMCSPIIAGGSYEGNVTLYGEGDNCDFRLSNVEVGAFGSSFDITGPDGETVRFRTRLLGRANVQNILGAAAVAVRLGIPLKSLVPAVAGLESVPHRLQLLSGGSGVWFIDDAYNSNPEGARTALETLSMCGDMVRIVLTPGMVELGEREEELNREMGRFAAGRVDYAVLVDKRRGPFIHEGLIEGGFDEDKIFMTDSFDKGLEFARALAGDKMILLLNDLPDHY